MKTTVQILTDARTILAKPRGYGKTGGVLAKNRAGWGVKPCAAEAVTFCMIGATLRAAGHETDEFLKAREFLDRAVGDKTMIFSERESTRKRDVLAAFGRAIALARKDARKAAAGKKRRRK